MITERGPRGLVRSRSLLAGSGVEIAQHPAKTISSPSVSTLSALPTPTEAASPPPAPTERATLSVQVAVLPEPPHSRRPRRHLLRRPVSRRRRSIQDFPGDRAISNSSGVPAQPVAPQALQEVGMPSKIAPSPRATQRRPLSQHVLRLPNMEPGWCGKSPWKGSLLDCNRINTFFVCAVAGLWASDLSPG